VLSRNADEIALVAFAEGAVDIDTPEDCVAHLEG